MSHTTPPAALAQNSAALIVGTITTTILAAPGATNAYRILTISASVNRSVGAAIVDFAFLDSIAGRFWQFGGASLAGKPYCILYFPFPGFQLTANALLQGQAISTVAAGIALYSVTYYVDSVT